MHSRSIVLLYLLVAENRQKKSASHIFRLKSRDGNPICYYLWNHAFNNVCRSHTGITVQFEKLIYKQALLVIMVLFAGQ
jgi:hypothetical protein